ncbi:ribbon-helix-helix protein, CopG family [Planosporangium flavigriseum]|nr:ribbon-helix-helix protein, CopG family [Planosporangium flavigriseum]
MTLRLDDEQTEALRQRAEFEGTSMQDVALRAVTEYIERHSRADAIAHYTQKIKTDYAEVLRRLGE